jgi:hypothetical protein
MAMDAPKPTAPKTPKPDIEFIELVEETIALRYIILAALIGGAVVFAVLWYIGKRGEEEG